MKVLTNNIPVVAGILTPLLKIHFSSVQETIILAALGAIISLIAKDLYVYLKKKIKKKFNEKFHKKITE